MTNMKLKHVVAGFAAGFVSAYIIEKKKAAISSGEALQIAKNAFKKNGTIDGSWIHTTTKFFEQNGLTFEGYNGGIIRTVDNLQEHYEFFIDKKSGAILDLKTVS